MMKIRIIVISLLVFCSCNHVEVKETYSDSGVIESSISYKKDIKHGSFKIYDEKGNLYKAGNYYEGELDGTFIQMEQGDTITMVLYEKGNTIEMVSYRNGVRVYLKNYVTNTEIFY